MFQQTNFASPDDKYHVTSYQQFVDMVNTAFASAFGNLAPGAPTANEPPVIVFDAKSQLFTIIVQKQYLADDLKIYMNAGLDGRFFGGFPSIINSIGVSSDGKDIEILVQNRPNTQYDATHYGMEQEYSTLFNWNSFKSIVLLTGSVPLRNEFIHLKTVDGEGKQEAIGSSDVSAPIITDFEPSVTGSDVRTKFQFSNSGEYRLIDLRTDQPMYHFDLQVYWRDNFGAIHPMYIPYGDMLTIKIMFRKKTSLNRILLAE